MRCDEMALRHETISFFTWKKGSLLCYSNKDCKQFVVANLVAE
jgi:hypothetical protein